MRGLKCKLAGIFQSLENQLLLPWGMTKSIGLLSFELPRDVICQFHYFKDKNAILHKLCGTPAIDFEIASIAMFLDFAKQTLEHHRVLRPLLDKLRADNISYCWSFPSCLVATKNRWSTPPEDLSTFCTNLKMDSPTWIAWWNPNFLHHPWVTVVQNSI